MNSIATAYITDFHKLIWQGRSDAIYLKLAKVVTVVMGVFGTLTAIWIALTNVDFIFDLFQEILGVIGGSLAGVFALAIFFKRSNSNGALVGIIGGALITLFVKYFTDLNGYLYGAVGVLSCVLIGMLVSLMFQKKEPVNIASAE